MSLLVVAPATATSFGEVYVSSAWAAVPAGLDPDGSGPATAMGADAFATIQGGLDAVDAGGTVHVAAGTYPELVSIAKAVTLEGANAGVDPNGGTRSGESVIDASGGGGTSNGIVIYGNASHVTIDGFELTGISGHILGGYETAAIIVKPGRNGSVPSSGDASTANEVEDVTIENNVLTDIGGRGVLKDDFATFDGLHILDNLFRNVDAGGDASAIKVQAGCDWSGCPRDRDLEIRGNVVDTTSDSGILLDDVDGVTIADNEITSVPVHGINVGNSSGTVTGDTLIQDNTITGAGTGSGGDAAVRIKPGTYDGSLLVHGNTIGDSRIGVLVESGVGVTGDFAVAENSFSGNSGADIQNLAAPVLDATGNWWGSSSAPGAVANVTTQPWCLLADCSVESDNATLTSLSLSSGSLSPTFAPSTTAYTAAVDNATASITTTASAMTGATVAGGGTTSLSAGDTTVTVTVTSADGTATTTYTIVVTRASPPPTTTASSAPATTGSSAPPPTTTTATTIATLPQVAANEPVSAPAVPGRSGSIAFVVAPAATSAAASPPPPLSVGVSWQPGTFAIPVTVLVTPRAAAGAPVGGPASPPAPPTVPGGFTIGGTVVQLTVVDHAGDPVTQLGAPLKLHLPALGAHQLPAYSHDGTSWTTIPELGAPELPAGQADGYFVNADGSVDIYTRHATLFGALVDVRAPDEVRMVHARPTRRFLRLRWNGSKDNVAVAGYVVSRNGHGYRATRRTNIALPLRAGRYVVRARDAAGNVGGRSRALTVVRGHDREHPFEVRG